MPLHAINSLGRISVNLVVLCVQMLLVHSSEVVQQSPPHHGQCCSNGIAEPHSWLDSSSLVVGIAIVVTLLPDTSCSLHDSPVVVPLLDIPMVHTAMLGSVVAAAVADTCPMALLGSDPTCGVVVVVVAGVVGIVLEEVEAEPIQE
jgi:hypothetical protein